MKSILLKMNWKKGVMTVATLGFLGTTLALSSVGSANTRSDGPIIPLIKPRDALRVPGHFQFGEWKPVRLPPIDPRTGNSGESGDLKTAQPRDQLPPVDGRTVQNESWIAWDWMKQELAAASELDGNGVTREIYAKIYTTAWSMASSEAEQAAIYATAWNDWNTIQ